MNHANAIGKKALSLLLAAVFILALLPVVSAPALAETPDDPTGSKVIQELGISAAATGRGNLSPYGRNKLTLLPVGEIFMSNSSQNRLFGHNAPVKNDILQTSISVTGMPTRVTASIQTAFDYTGTGKKDWVAFYYYLRESATKHTFKVLAVNPVTSVNYEVYSRTYTDTLRSTYFEGVSNKESLLVMAAGNFNGSRIDSLAILDYMLVPDYMLNTEKLMLTVITLTGRNGSTEPWLPNVVSGLAPYPGLYGGAHSLSAGDLNNDGVDDLAYSRSYFGSTKVYLSGTTVFWGEPYDIRLVLSGNCFLRSTSVPDSRDRKIFAAGNTIGDVDGDGRKELIVGGVTSSLAGFTTNDYYNISGSSGWSNAFDVYSFQENDLKLTSSGRFSINSGRPNYISAANLAIARMDGLTGVGTLFMDNNLYRCTVKDDKTVTWSHYKDLTSHSTITAGTHRSSQAVAVDLSGDRQDSVMWKVPTTGGAHQVLAVNRDGVIRTILGGNSASSISFSTPNTDEDSPVLELVDHKLYYSDPLILAAIASPPYYKDLMTMETGSYQESSTSFGKGKTSGSEYETGTTTTTGTFVSVSSDIEIMGIPVGSGSFETEFTNTLTDSVAQFTEVSTAITYDTLVGQDSFVVYTYPTDGYQYVIHQPNKTGQAFTAKDESIYVMVPSAPVHAIVDAQLYTEVAAKYDLPGAGLAEDVFTHKLGYPESYPTESTLLPHAKRNSIYVPGDYIGTSFGNSNIAYDLELSTGTTESTQWTNAVTYKGGGGPGGGILGGTAGGVSGTEDSYTRSTTNISSMMYTTTMFAFPGEAMAYSSSYGFKWRMMQYIYQGVQEFPVVQYQLKDVNVPPTLPEDIEYTITSNAIGAAWTQSQLTPEARAATTGYKVQLLETTGANEKVSDLNITGTYTAALPSNINLAPYTPYFIEMQATGTGGKLSIPVREQIWTYKENMGVILFTDYQEGVITGEEASATISVKAKEVTTASSTSYQWQVLQLDGTWANVAPSWAVPATENVPSEERTKIHKLTISNPAIRVNSYRLLITQVDAGVSYESLSDIIMLRGDTPATVTIDPTFGGRATGTGTYYPGQHVTVSVPATLKTGEKEWQFGSWNGGENWTYSDSTYSFIVKPNINYNFTPSYKIDVADAITGITIDGVPRSSGSSYKLEVKPGESHVFDMETTGAAPLDAFRWRLSGDYTSKGTYLTEDGELFVGEDETVAIFRLMVETLNNYPGSPSNNRQQVWFDVYTGIPVPYDEDAVAQIRDFLMQPSLTGIRNGDVMGWDLSDPSTWTGPTIYSGGWGIKTGVHWRVDTGDSHYSLVGINLDATATPIFNNAAEIEFYAKVAQLSGQLDLSNLGLVSDSVKIRGTGISSIDLSGNRLTAVYLENNQLESVALRDMNSSHYHLNLQGNRLNGFDSLDLTGSTGFKAYNLRGLDLTEEQIASLPKTYPFSIYYGSAQAKYRTMLSSTDKEISIDMLGNPDLTMDNTGAAPAFTVAKSGFVHNAHSANLDSYYREATSGYEFTFGKPTADIAGSADFSKITRLPNHVFNELVKVYFDYELLTETPETDDFRFEVTWDNPNTPRESERDNPDDTNEQVFRSVAIKAIPKKERIVLYDYSTEDASFDLAQLLADPGGMQRGWERSYDPSTATFNVTVVADKINVLGMELLTSDNEVVPEGYVATYNVAYNPGEAWNNLTLDGYKVKNTGNCSVGLTIRLAGDDADKLGFADYYNPPQGLKQGETADLQLYVDFEKMVPGVYTVLLEVELGTFEFDWEIMDLVYKTITQTLPVVVTVTDGVTINVGSTGGNSSSSLDFPDLDAGYTSPPKQTVVIKNTTGSAVEATLKLIGPDSGAFILEDDGKPKIWQEGDNEVTVSVKRGLSAGFYQATLMLEPTSGDTVLPALDLSLNVTDDGTGGKLGDINGDGNVNATDLSILLANFGKTGDAVTNPAADINKDGNINATDLSILLANFGK